MRNMLEEVQSIGGCRDRSISPVELTLPLVTAYVCAMSRAITSLAQPGRTWKEVLGSAILPDTERFRGPEPDGKAAMYLKACTDRRRKTRTLWQELHCPKFNSQEE